MNALLAMLVLMAPPSDLDMSGADYARDFSDLCMSGDAAPRSQAAKSKRSFELYAPTWCPHCAKPKKDVESLRSEFDVQIKTNSDEYPEWVINQAGQRDWGFPLVHWETRSGAGQVMVWTTLDAFRGADGTGQFASKLDAAAPTPGQEVERVIGLLPKPEIGFVDFGCGDARWCIAAAERWGCRVTGIEIDPARAAAARERVRSVGLGHLITIIEGDATKTDITADVGVAYLYADVLEQLRPRLEKLRAFASYMHRPPGLPVIQNGKTWLYVRPVASQSRAAVWQGQLYSQPVCNDQRCSMCNSIRQQLNSR